MAETFKPSQGVSYAKLRLETDGGTQLLQESALAGNTEFIWKIAFDFGDDLEGVYRRGFAGVVHTGLYRKITIFPSGIINTGVSYSKNNAVTKKRNK